MRLGGRPRASRTLKKLDNLRDLRWLLTHTPAGLCDYAPYRMVWCVKPTRPCRGIESALQLQAKLFEVAADGWGGCRDTWNEREHSDLNPKPETLNPKLPQEKREQGCQVKSRSPESSHCLGTQPRFSIRHKTCKPQNLEIPRPLHCKPRCRRFEYSNCYF